MSWGDHCIGEPALLRGDDMRKIKLACIFATFHTPPTRDRKNKTMVLTILLREGKKNKDGR